MKIAHNLSTRSLSLFKRFIAISLSICVFFLDFSAYAHEIQFSPSSSISATPSINLHLPEEFGSVIESFEGNSDKKVIYIQDAHDSLDAQISIAKTIHYLVEKHNARTVLEEGYEGLVPTDEYFGYLDKKTKEKVSYYLLDKLRLGAAEYAHINRKKDFKLIGADNMQQHLQSMQWYQRAMQSKTEIDRAMSELREELKVLANQRFTEPLKNWIKIKTRFEAKEIEFVSYLSRTINLGGMKAQDLEKFPELQNVFMMSQGQDSANVENLKDIQVEKLLDQVERLEESLLDQWIQNDKDHQLFSYLQTLDLVQKLSSIQLAQHEYLKIRDELDEIDTQEIAEFIARESRKTIVISKEWEKGIRSAILFYETALSRDDAVGLRLDEFVDDNNEKVAVLIFGGFHKARIRELLREKDISYQIITPAIHELDERHQQYYKQLMSGKFHDYEVPIALTQGSRTASKLFFARMGGVKARSEVRKEIENLAIAANALESGEGLQTSEWVRQMDLMLSETTQRSEVRTTAQSGVTWFDYISQEIDKHDDPYKAWWAIKDSLSHVVGGRTLWLRDLEVRSMPVELDKDRLEDQDIRDIGDMIREKWTVNKWNHQFGSINQDFMMLSREQFMDAQQFIESTRRGVLLSGGSLKHKLVGDWAGGVTLAVHLREDGYHGGVDNQLLIENVRRFIPNLLAWMKTDNFNRPIPTTPGNRSTQRPLASQFDIMLWGLSVMLDPSIHDPLAVHEELPRQGWPTDTRETIINAVTSMLMDLDRVDEQGEPTGEKITAKEIRSLLSSVFARTDGYWEQVGLRSPWGVAVSGVYDQVMFKFRRLMPNRIFADPFFMIALHPNQYQDGKNWPMQGFNPYLREAYSDPRAFAVQVYFGEDWREINSWYEAHRARLRWHHMALLFRVFGSKRSEIRSSETGDTEDMEGASFLLRIKEEKREKIQRLLSLQKKFTEQELAEDRRISTSSDYGAFAHSDLEMLEHFIQRYDLAADNIYLSPSNDSLVQGIVWGVFSAVILTGIFQHWLAPVAAILIGVLVTLVHYRLIEKDAMDAYKRESIRLKERGPRKILDVGTGDGLIALIMAELTDGEVTTIELDPERADWARRFREYLADHGIHYPNVTYLEGDFLDHDIRDYDGVYFYYAGPAGKHTWLAYKILRKINQDLKPGAVFMSPLFGSYDDHERLQILDRYFSSDRNLTYDDFFIVTPPYKATSGVTFFAKPDGERVEVEEHVTHVGDLPDAGSSVVIPHNIVMQLHELNIYISEQERFAVIPNHNATKFFVEHMPEPGHVSTIEPAMRKVTEPIFVDGSATHVEETYVVYDASVAETNHERVDELQRLLQDRTLAAGTRAEYEQELAEKEGHLFQVRRQIGTANGLTIVRSAANDEWQPFRVEHDLRSEVRSVSLSALRHDKALRLSLLQTYMHEYVKEKGPEGHVMLTTKTHGIFEPSSFGMLEHFVEQFDLANDTLYDELTHIPATPILTGILAFVISSVFLETYFWAGFVTVIVMGLTYYFVDRIEAIHKHKRYLAEKKRRQDRPLKKILDIGTGDGLAAFALAELSGAEVTSIEIDPGRAAFARGFRDFLKTKGIEYPNLKFIEGNFFDHDISEYDGLYFYYAYPYGRAKWFSHRILRKLEKELKANAVFVSSLFGSYDDVERHRLVNEFFSKRRRLRRDYLNLDVFKSDYSTLMVRAVNTDRVESDLVHHLPLLSDRGDVFELDEKNAERIFEFHVTVSYGIGKRKDTYTITPFAGPGKWKVEIAGEEQKAAKYTSLESEDQNGVVYDEMVVYDTEVGEQNFARVQQLIELLKITNISESVRRHFEQELAEMQGQLFKIVVPKQTDEKGFKLVRLSAKRAQEPFDLSFSVRYEVPGDRPKPQPAPHLVAMRRNKSDQRKVDDRGRKRSEVRMPSEDSQIRQTSSLAPFVILNKPAGVLSQEKINLQDPETPIAIDLIPEQYRTGERHFLGRLDKATTGLYLYGGHTQLHHILLNPTADVPYKVPKTYEVVVNKRVSRQTLKRLQRGVTISVRNGGGRHTQHFSKFDSVEIISRNKSRTKLRIVLTEGKNLQIRKTMSKVGHPVEELQRVAFGPIKLGSLAEGEVRELTVDEYRWLEEYYQQTLRLWGLPDEIEKAASKKETKKVVKKRKHRRAQRLGRREREALRASQVPKDGKLRSEVRVGMKPMPALRHFVLDETDPEHPLLNVEQLAEDVQIVLEYITMGLAQAIPVGSAWFQRDEDGWIDLSLIGGKDKADLDFFIAANLPETVDLWKYKERIRLQVVDRLWRELVQAHHIGKLHLPDGLTREFLDSLIHFEIAVRSEESLKARVEAAPRIKRSKVEERGGKTPVERPDWIWSIKKSEEEEPRSEIRTTLLEQFGHQFEDVSNRTANIDRRILLRKSFALDRQPRSQTYIWDRFTFEVGPEIGKHKRRPVMITHLSSGRQWFHPLIDVNSIQFEHDEDDPYGSSIGGIMAGKTRFAINTINGEVSYPARSELRRIATTTFQASDASKLVLIDFNDMVEGFNRRQVIENVITMTQRPASMFVIYNRDLSHSRDSFVADLVRGLNHVHMVMLSGQEAFNRYGAKFDPGQVVSISKIEFDPIERFNEHARSEIRLFKYSGSEIGVAAVALDYDPAKLVFREHVQLNGGFYTISRALMKVAAQYLKRFVFASSA